MTSPPTAGSNNDNGSTDSSSGANNALPPLEAAQRAKAAARRAAAEKLNKRPSALAIANAAKKATPSDVKKFTSQTLKTTLHHLQLSNDFFLSPPEREIPREEIGEIQRLLDQIKVELLAMDDKHKDWIEITTPAGG